MAFILSDIKSGGIYAIREGKKRKTVTVFEDYDDARDFSQYMTEQLGIEFLNVPPNETIH